MKTIAVVVFGDVGRSPRTTNHALMLAQMVQDSDVVIKYLGFSDSDTLEDVRKTRNLYISPLPQYLLNARGCRILQPFWWYFASAVNVVVSTFMLVCQLLHFHDLGLVVLQSPPAFPTLVALPFLRMFSNACIIVDWHNLAYGILTQRKINGTFLKLLQVLEVRLGHLAHVHLCVSDAMKILLSNRHGIHAETLRDAPRTRCRAIGPIQKHCFLYPYFGGRFTWEELQVAVGGDLRERTISSLDVKVVSDHLLSLLEAPSSIRVSWSGCGVEWCLGRRLEYSSVMEDACLTIHDEALELKTHSGDRIAIKTPPKDVLIAIVPTSWTQDEDVLMLLDIGEEYDKMEGPNIIFVVTGRGPNKESMAPKLLKKKFKKILIITAFFQIEDYYTFLTCCDFGVSLHTSATGVDLPYKIIDMLSAGTHAMAFNYGCMQEMTETFEGVHVFNSAEELASMMSSFEGSILPPPSITWQTEWNRVLKSQIRELL